MSKRMTGIGNADYRRGYRDGLEAAPQDCPNITGHTAEPEGYLAWRDWAERKSKTHRQHKCPGCGLWAIWEKKPSSAAGEGEK